MPAEPHRLIWEAAPAEDERLRLVLNHIDELCRAGLTSLMVVVGYLCCHLAPLRERARFAWMYTGSGDITRTHIGVDGDLDEGALVTLLKVVTGVDDHAWAVLPREDLALCTDQGRVVLQASMPEFDTKGLVDCPGRRNPGTIQIPGVDEEAGNRQQAGGRDAACKRQQAGGRDAAGSRPIA